MNKPFFKIGNRLLALVVLYFSSCAELQNTLVQIDNTNAILAKAVQTLNDQSVSWQETLATAQKQLTSDFQSTIRNEITDLITRSTATAGSQVICLTDFLRERLKNELSRLIEVNNCREKNITIPRLKPHFCISAPNSIDMVDAPDRRNKIDFYGFDFDRAQGIEIYVLDVAGNIIADGTRYLAVVTHYNMVLNLSNGNGLALNTQASAIVLYWGGIEISRIAVRQPAPPPPCTMHEVNIAPNQPYFSHKPAHDPSNGNDGTFSCGRMNFQYTVRLRIRADKKAIIARIYMFGEECCHGAFECPCWGNCHSQVRAEKEETIFYAPTGAIIQAILSDTYYEAPFTRLGSGNGGENVKIHAGGNFPIVLAACKSPRDTGEGVTITIEWSSIKLRVCK